MAINQIHEEARLLVWRAVEQAARAEAKEIEDQAMAFVRAGFPVSRLVRLTSFRGESFIVLKKTDKEVEVGSYASDNYYLDTSFWPMTPGNLPPEALATAHDAPIIV